MHMAIVTGYTGRVVYRVSCLLVKANRMIEMKEKIGVRILFFYILTFLFLGCKDSLVSFQHSMGVQGEGFAVRIFVDGLASGSGRTIAPEHVTLTELADPSKYTVRLTGTSNMGDSRDEVLTVNNKGLGIFLLTPGSWTLTLTVTEVATRQQILQGKTFIVVENAPTVTHVTLKPLTGTGTVEVNFVLSPSLLKRLVVTNPTGTGTTGLAGATGTATLTATLYDVGGTPIPGTEMPLNAQITGANTIEQTLTYTANAQPIPAGQYILKLIGSFPKKDGSIEPMGYEDVLYVEGNRRTTTQITLASNSKDLGVPENPIKVDKAKLNGSSKTNNFTRVTSFTPWGETLWLFADYWDSEGNGNNGGNGNEVLVATWTPVINADFYEIEILVYPFVFRASNGVKPNITGKFQEVVTDDVAWDNLKDQTFSRAGYPDQTNKKPSFLKYSGDPNSPYYYKTSTQQMSATSGSNGGTYHDNFLSCAYKPYARQIFGGSQSSVTAAAANSAYRCGTAMDEFDNGTTFSYANVNHGKIGLEGDCGSIGILLPAFAPQCSLVFRMRAVNEYGYSDWVYWKGGTW